MARFFDQIDDGLLRNTANFGTLGQLSMFCWFACESNATPQTLVRWGEQGGAPFVGAGLSLVSGKVNGYHSTNNSLANLVGTSSHPTAGTTWWSAGMSNDVAGAHALYVNGVSEVTGTQAGGSAVNRTANTDLMVGYSKNFGERYKGRVAEVAIWSVALTAGEHAALARGVHPTMIRRGALIFYGPLWGSGSPEPDYTNSQAALTVTGAAVAAHAPVRPWFAGDLWVPTSVAAAGAAVIPLDPAAATSAGTLALTAQTQVPLQASAASSNATLALTAQTTVPLASSAAQSTATLALTAPARVALDPAAAQSTTALALTAPTRVPLGTAVAASAGTLALTAPTRVLLGTSTAQSSATLSLTAQTYIPLGTSTGTSTGTLTVSVPSSTIPLQTAAGTSSATLALTAKTTVTLGASSATATGTISITAKTAIGLQTAAALSTGALTVFTPTPVVLLLDPASVTSAATLTLAQMGNRWPPHTGTKWSAATASRWNVDPQPSW